MSRTVTQTLLDAVLAQLATAFTPEGQSKPSYEIAHFPDDPRAYRLNHPKGALLVRSLASEYAPPAPSGMRSGALTGQRTRPQERTLVLRVTVQFRQLNGSDGVTAVVDQVGDALCGFMPPGAHGGLYLVADGFIGVEDGIWEHAIDVAVPTRAPSSAVT